MGAYVKQIVVGDEPTVGSGINPSHYLFLYDGDRPAWSLGTFGLHDSDGGDRRNFSLIPRSPNFIDRDTLVLVAALVLHDPNVLRVLRDHVESGLRRGLVELDHFHEKALCDLDAAIASIQRWPRMFAMNFEGAENQFWPLSGSA